jgi:signal transduction histidine kinase
MRELLKDSASSKVFSMFVPLLLPVLSLLISLALKPVIGAESLFLLFIPAVIAASFYLGFKAGLSTTFLSMLLISLSKSLDSSLTLNTINFNKIFEPIFLFNLSLFLAESIFLSYIINYLRQTDLLNQFRKIHKTQASQLIDLKEKLLVAQNEIKIRDEFLAIASHELKNPLTSMLLQLQSALHNIKNVSLANFSVENLLRMLESVENQTNRLSKMISDLLNVSLITTKKLDLDLEEVNLSKLTKDIVEGFYPKLEKEGYQIKLEAGQEIVGKYDKVRLEQAITNLITNAIKYGDKKPIEVKVYNTGGTGKILVKDQGIGIPFEQKDKIFSLFERATPAIKFEGLGVGLYITNQIVQAHHGKIHVESQENEGSTFVIELPLEGQVEKR